MDAGGTAMDAGWMPIPGSGTADAGSDGGRASGIDGGAALPEDGSCFTSDHVLPLKSGNGSCAAPFLIDLTDGSSDEVFAFQPDARGGDEDVPPLGKCGEGLTRDLVFTVHVPPGLDLEVTARGAATADPIVLVQQPVSQDCRKSNTVQCQDDTAAAECEYLRLRASSDAFEGQTTRLVVSEAVASGDPLTLVLRLRDPGSGA